MSRIFSLDTGETEALAVMKKNPNAIFFTDDASARLVAKQMGFKLTGQLVSLFDRYAEVSWSLNKYCLL